MEQRPSVGRIVHFHVRDAAKVALITKAALITEVLDERLGHVTLRVFGFLPEHDYGLTALFSQEPKADYWTWPPRV